MRNLPIVISGALLMTLAGCRSQVKKIDACALLTKSEVQAAIGEPVTAPENSRQTESISECRYTTTSSPSREVIVNVLQPDFGEPGVDSPAARLFADEMTKAVKAGFVRHLPGIGSDAFWDGHKLHVLQGRTYFFISAGSAAEPNSPVTAQQLAQEIVLKL